MNKCVNRVSVLLMMIVLLCTSSIFTVAMASDDGYKNELGPKKIQGKWDFAWPAPNVTQLTSCFFDNRGHYAIDIGTAGDVNAMYAGTVVYAKWVSGFGNSIMIEHKGYVTATGEKVTLYTHYGHLSKMKVSAKDPVKKGQTIGVAGDTGTSDGGVHLDFLILLNSKDVSPAGRKASSLDPFSNMLLPPPSGLKGSDYSKQGGCNCKPYVKDVLAFYEANKESVQYSKIDDIPRIAKSIKDSTAADTCRLQSMPYDAEKYYTGKLEKGTIVYLKGAVKNSHGNTWYETQDGKFIYSGDLEILEKDASYTEAAYGAIGVSKNKECWLKDKPYEASAHNAAVAKGKSVEIVAKAVNSHGNTWYKTADGKYVYSSDVDVYTYTKLFDISAKFKNTEKRDSHMAPYVDSADAATYKKNAEVTVTRFVVNSHGNIWAQLTDGSYLCFYDFDSKEQKLTYVSSKDAVTVSDVKKPSGNLAVGAVYDLRGVLKSNMPFYEVAALVIDSKTGYNALDPVCVYPAMTLRKIDLNANVKDTKTNKNVNINYKVLFNNLKKGWYAYAVTAQMGFTYNGTTFKFGNMLTTILSDFTVGNPGALADNTVLVEKIVVTNQVSELKYGQPYDFTWEVYPSNATNKRVEWWSSNTDVIWMPSASGLPGVDEDVVADVFYEGCGTATINVKAKDSSGVSYSFKVKVNHNYDETITTSPTCTTNGVKTFTCIGCGHEYTESIAALGHKEVKDAAVASTCTTTGLTEGKRCERCGTVLVAQQSVPALGHSYSEKVTTAATCTANGVKTYTCGKCSHSYTESIAAVGHKEVKDAAVASTCTTTGLTEGKHCERCGTVLVAQMEVAVLGHSEGEMIVVTEPSATKPGSAMVCCETCGELIRMEEIPALGIARIPGDANEDGKVDILDALLTLQYSVGWDVEINIDNANVNGDAAVNIMDALLILQYSVGWEVKLQ